MSNDFNYEFGFVFEEIVVPDWSTLENHDVSTLRKNSYSHSGVDQLSYNISTKIKVASL